MNICTFLPLVCFLPNHLERKAFEFTKPSLYGEYPPEHWQEIINRSMEQINFTSPVVSAKTSLIILVPLRPNDTEKRNSIRNLWASKKFSQTIEDGNATVLFLMANHSISEDLQRESDDFGDLLVVFGFEEYRRLVYKIYYGYKWATTYYPEVDVAKVDSDVILVTDNLYAAVMKETNENSITGFVQENGEVIRDQNDKWYISHWAFNSSNYPRYLFGFTCFFKSKALAKIVEASSQSSVFENEDAFFSGVMASKAGVEVKAHEQIFYPKPKEVKCEEGKPLLIAYAQEKVDLEKDFQDFIENSCKNVGIKDF